MAEQKGSKRAGESLETKARQILARRAGDKKLTVAAVGESVLLSSGKRLSRFEAFPEGRHNDEHFSVLLDESGAEVDLGALSASDRAAVFSSPGSAAVASTVRSEAAALSGVKIDPQVNLLVLEPGDSHHEVITVTIPAGAAKADIYFLADTTGSMGSILDAVKTGASSMLNALQGLGFDMAFGVGNYKDFPVPPNPYAFTHQQSLTKTVPAALNAINNWTPGDGQDIPEGQLFALDQIAQPLGGTIGWRSGSKKIIVWFGDAPGHDPICQGISGLPYDITEASVTQKLVQEVISVLAISTNTGTANALDGDPMDGGDYSGTCTIGGTPGQGTRIATCTGGVHQAGIDASKIVQTIIDLVTKALEIKNVSLIPTGGTKPFVVSITPAGGYGPLAGDKEHTLFFDVDFKGIEPCAAEEKLFSGMLDVVADGKVVAQKRVRIIVPPCRVYSYSVKFVCGIQDDCRCEGGPVRPGVYATEINIYNDGDVDARVEKWLVPIVFGGAVAGREPRSVQSRARDSIVLPPKSATMDDCHRIGELLYGAQPASPMALTLGFLEIASHQPLNVVAVYTVTGVQGGPVSIEVETVEPRLKRGRLVPAPPTPIPG
jgi:hypothetical protein